MIITQILASITTIAFLFFGLVKVVGVPTKMFELQKGQFFDKFGIGRHGIRMIGLAEWTGASLLAACLIAGWTPGVWGSGIHCAVTIGAIGSHLRFGKPADAFPAIGMLILSIGVLAGFYLTSPYGAL